MKVRILVFFLAVIFMSSTSSKTSKFIKRWDSVAIDMSNRTGIPASVLLACGALESGWGTSKGAVRYNAYHGIKGKYESKGKQLYYRNSDGIARAYPTAWESWKDHAFLLKARNWYKDQKPKAHASAEEWSYWVSRWHVGLKVDKSKKDAYHNKVMRIINQYNLRRLDGDKSQVY